MNLSEIFSAVAHKELVAVDLPHAGSHQHELNGVAALKALFGTKKKIRGRISWHYFPADNDPEEDEGDFTFYDARAKSTKNTGRTEWRFYYFGNFLSRAKVGDLLVLARTTKGKCHGLIFQKNSEWQRAALELFPLRELQPTLDLVPKSALHSQRVEFLRQQILSELDLDFTLPVSGNDEQLVLEKFGRGFPTTREMSAFARTQTRGDVRNPDEMLTSWLEREEQLFRALENIIIRERLDKKFATVEDFIQYSLTVQNRRKSRMGLALQNHLAELFTRQSLRFTAQAQTEGNNRPDFIFPGQREYHDITFSASLLVMLGAKSTSKDRWRQVLSEADRVPHKHLCTLEASISTKQTDEMRRQNLTLVVPSSLHPTYTTEQRSGLLSVADFIGYVRAKQK